MANLVRWSPLSDLMSLHNAMDRLFGESFGIGQPTGRTVAVVGEGYLPLDVYQIDKDWVIRAAVPGADPNAVEVTFDGGTITIRGEIKAPENSHPENFWLRENFFGKFNRQVTLPEDVLGEQSKAQFQNGMLTITVPKTEPARPKSVKIPINAEARQLDTAAKR